ncbi:polysaccharide biosynthesis tyrosine autokinase, partial [Rahnella sp. SL6]|uniref:polysaccharide biosynthesis tyrosine autokinase n=1 Tax=Rahnella perminowiae TaxID=2816244 RepID=UPI001C258734
SFISANLAVVMGQLDKKVLLIDGDMRKGFAHKVMGVSDRIGLSNLLTADISYSEAIKTISKGNIDFLGRGPIPPNPAELLMTPRFSKLIEWATTNYDLVIIDSPPILAVTDAAIIGRHAGTNLMVARFEDTTTKDIEISLSRFEQSGVNINGCILNG